MLENNLPSDDPSELPPGDHTPQSTTSARSQLPIDPESNESVLEQMGGTRGLVFSTVPVLAFVPINTVWGLTIAIWSAIAAALALLLWTVVRREKIQPAISAFFGVAICVFIAWRTGSAKGYFLYGIIVQTVYFGALALSALSRWPLVGVIWSFLNGSGQSWQRDKVVRRYYSVATWVWAAVFGVRAILQWLLYQNDEVGWLGFARVAMGWPLALVGFAATIWSIRRVNSHRDSLEAH